MKERLMLIGLVFLGLMFIMLGSIFNPVFFVAYVAGGIIYAVVFESRRRPWYFYEYVGYLGYCLGWIGPALFGAIFSWAQPNTPLKQFLNPPR